MAGSVMTGPRTRDAARCPNLPCWSGDRWDSIKRRARSARSDLEPMRRFALVVVGIAVLALVERSPFSHQGENRDPSHHNEGEPPHRFRGRCALNAHGALMLPICHHSSMAGSGIARHPEFAGRS